MTVVVSVTAVSSSCVTSAGYLSRDTALQPLPWWVDPLLCTLWLWRPMHKSNQLCYCGLCARGCVRVSVHVCPCMCVHACVCKCLEICACVVWARLGWGVSGCGCVMYKCFFHFRTSFQTCCLSWISDQTAPSVTVEQDQIWKPNWKSLQVNGLAGSSGVYGPLLHLGMYLPWMLYSNFVWLFIIHILYYKDCVW